MPLMNLTAACLAHGHWPLLDRADFQLDAGERVALIGANGSGKSSLMKVLCGEQRLDDGECWRAPGVRLGWVPQEPEFEETQTVFDTVVSGLSAASLLREYHEVAHALAEGNGTGEAGLERLHELQVELESASAWSAHFQVEKVIEQCALNGDALVSTLSGGQRKRLALARAMVAAPDALLLDEPTNHLDLDGIAWLEQTLVQSAISLIFVTHDRHFLDQVATRIVELDRGLLASFPGTFSQYQERKQQMLADEQVQNQRFDKLLKEEEVWIRKGVEARRTRAQFRVQRLEKLRLQRQERRERSGSVSMKLDSGERSGQRVAELEGVSLAYGPKVILRDFSCRILRGDRVGIVGRNGAGKTSLLKLILGQIEADAGTVIRGTRLNVAYFDQFREQLDPESTLADIISPGSDYVEIGRERKHVIGYLGDFLFSPQRAQSPVRTLSGGERNRLLLARLFARPANVLVMDEPTNDLDMETLALLEQLLIDYPGTVLLVSHDRVFLNNVVTQVIGPVGAPDQGRWLEQVGGYEDWLETCRRMENPDTRASAAIDPVPDKAVRTRSSKKLSYKDQRELEALPGRIELLEAEQKKLEQQLSDSAFFVRDPQAAVRASDRLGEIEEELLMLLERWEILETLKEQGAPSGNSSF